MEKKPLTVTALNKYLKYCFDHDVNLQYLFVKGEISNFKHHGSGHFYFTLKDEFSQINAVMFQQYAKNINFQCEDGMKVIVEGYVSLYTQGGTYQIYVSNIILDGLGELFLRYEKLKEKLAKEGLFAPEHKLPIPKYPKKIGVITSNTGAAIRDILTTIERRFPLCEVIVFPTLVQGEYAKDDIVKSIKKANLYKGLDLIILGRGGGSIEDLWCFNEEEVAYAIYESKIPIISAVGHETDFTISDFVSDLRAATPTAAAELAVPNKADLMLYLRQVKNRMNQSIINNLKNNQVRLQRINQSYIFMQPHRLYENYYFRLDKYLTILEKNNPLTQINKKQESLKLINERLNYYFEKRYSTFNFQFKKLMEKLELVNPLSLINKGYAIIKKEDKTITSIKELQNNDKLEILVSDGVIYSEVKDKEVKKWNNLLKKQ
ncbi:MAG TPA: exodeoxyribonuclease VII large subunit [Haloplasmataceae bacterium]